MIGFLTPECLGDCVSKGQSRIGAQNTEEFASQSVWNENLLSRAGLAQGQKTYCGSEFQHCSTSISPSKYQETTKPRTLYFLPGWWLIPACILGPIIWAVLIGWALS